MGKEGLEIVDFVKREIDKLENREAGLKRSILVLTKEKERLIKETGGLKNEIITKRKDAEAEIEREKKRIKKIEEDKRESLNQTKSLEAQAQERNQSLGFKIRETDTKLNNIQRDRNQLDKDKADFQLKIDKLEKVKDIIRGI